MKKFTKFEIATIKRTAQNVNPMVTKKAKIAKDILALKEEWDRLDTMQSQYEESIKTMTGGYTTEDLVVKVVEPTNSVDKNGNPIKITKYVLRYPDTVIPPVCDEESCCTTEGVVEEPSNEGNEEVEN